MTSKIRQKIELVTNIAIILVAILFGYFLIQNFLFTGQNQPVSQKGIAKGTKISLPDVEWQKDQKTILLVLQKSCKYCTESIPFYKTLIPKASEKGIRVIAVLPGSLEESNQYFNENGLKIQEIRQLSLNEVNAQGTPTLILLNDKGEVSNSWVGKLLPDKEQEVVNQL